MRILGYASAAIEMIIFFSVIVLVAGILFAVMSAMGIKVPFSRDHLVYVMAIAGATFILLAVFDYAYRVIEGEEQ